MQALKRSKKFYECEKFPSAAKAAIALKERERREIVNEKNTMLPLIGKQLFCVKKQINERSLRNVMNVDFVIDQQLWSWLASTVE